ncbi:enoyl-CoA hydratase/isomerase family protein [Prescottella equi]
MTFDPHHSELTTSPPPYIQAERAGHVMIIRLNRPAARNALTADMLATLLTCISQSESDSSISGLVLTGNGSAFCAGDDLYDAARGSAAEFEQTIARFQMLSSVLLDSRLVSIAAINGPAIGGGFELTLACDLRICSDQATFACPEARWGLLATNAASVLLPAVIGRGRALEMALTGRVYDASWAQSVGLVTEIVDARSLVGAATDLVSAVSASAESARLTRAMFAEGVADAVEGALRRESAAVSAAFQTEFAQRQLLPFKSDRSRKVLR